MAKNNEAQARIKINKLLEESQWRFEDSGSEKANIRLEADVKFENLGDDFEDAETHDKRRGAIDFLLLDKDGRALVVVEAKKESIDPLSAKEQARNYARNINARFIILSNGNIHYFWDTKHGNPETISRFPTQESISQFEKWEPNAKELADTKVDENYIIETQMPGFANDPLFQEDRTKMEYLKNNNLKQLRPYQIEAIKSLQSSALNAQNRFLFEMATGTGKTLISAAVLKLFLKSGNARRILFLVDRLELEDQALKAFRSYLGKDYTTVIYKEAKDSWQNAQVVVSTIQTFLAGDRYKKEFSPTDFELVISDEAHRSIGGNSRAVFEYFIGYKLGLTATPKDYLKGLNGESADSQREFERRLLLDTYKTFGCESGEPTFRYSLLDGTSTKSGGPYLINPVIVDARTEITTQLLSDEGYSVHITNDDGEEVNMVYSQRHFERKFFNEETNIAMCKAFMDNALYDQVAKQIDIDLFGKSIVFCVSQRHAAKVTNILNKLAFQKWPDQYNESDFAVQVTSSVQDAQQMTINFSNNTLNGKTKNPEGYDSSKTRVTVTVGMMTTGYDCPDILNLALMRPLFSPSDFVQIKGRGTRKYLFEHEDYEVFGDITAEKKHFKFFDFFATCEYFENEFKYDEKIKLPHIKQIKTQNEVGDNQIAQGEFVDENVNKIFKGPFDLDESDQIETVVETPIGAECMRIDREGFIRAVEEDILGNETLKTMWVNGDTLEAVDFVKKYIIDKPKNFLNLDKVRRAFKVDRRISVIELLQVAFGEKDAFEMKDDLLESEWSKFQEVHDVDQEHFAPVKMFFKAYVTDKDVRDIMETRQTARFNTESSFHFDEYQQLNGYKEIVPRYIKDYISLNTFMN
ncbi:DEAD/DEAH box helicase family protein [Candidatus Peregrinibacteria bacterium]|jgi:type I restriction enzyme, R subunit|nr:DEAD/DEAH box helicase family protein [Candidatus Peregrinibacteria bacterium]MBT3598638.1 DEAD/DEAH box helicase family protein [Candidatus Peregrinibacteria bacterium]MBT4367398.1 DEAD/DEAH box helicase family protein [Candidatus Peregrinibacteria bacterium]MBT6730963.1 DEAD/DEAH box helicase family protein [Candidatus Peregrinibacteria bacterium]MBT7009896.1 DEAD/DEAH box helicase family protein [Candidatus Peregrinibacteria bacterium]